MTRATPPAPPVQGRRALVAGAASLLVLVAVGSLGDSAAVPGLGPGTAWPPWDLGLGPPAVAVTVVAAAGYLLGGAALWWGLRAIRAGGGGLPGARTLVTIGLLAAAALTLVPPAGSADHLSYLAYGRIAAAGDDPYAVAPSAWRGGTDPVAGAVQPPWQDTPDVYGPVATAVFALAAAAGGDSVRTGVWVWSLVCALAFGAVGLLLHAAHRGDERARRRAALLWTANPVLLAQLVLGAHVDVLAAALAVAALVLAVRRPLPAGMLLGLAASVKAPYAVFGLAAAWALWSVGRQVGSVGRAIAAGLAGAVGVAVPAHLLAGPHVFDQLGTASGFTSIASPWRAVVNVVELVTGSGSLRPVVVPAALLVAAGLGVALGSRVLGSRVLGSRVLDPAAEPASVVVRADPAATVARAALVAGGAWVLAAPYTLPWYDAMLWAPLALVAVTDADELAGLEDAVTVRLVVLALAYLPGRVVGMGPLLSELTLGGRRYLAPPLVLAAVVAVVLWARGGRWPRPPRSAAAG